MATLDKTANRTILLLLAAIFAAITLMELWLFYPSR
jgi:hypothetical protein